MGGVDEYQDLGYKDSTTGHLGKDNDAAAKLLDESVDAVGLIIAREMHRECVGRQLTHRSGGARNGLAYVALARFWRPRDNRHLPRARRRSRKRVFSRSVGEAILQWVVTVHFFEVYASAAQV
jgi:hypothetical protein